MTVVEVATSENQTSVIYVAEAKVLQTLKPDLVPLPEERTIAIVGSTVPMSSAVWRPIETQQYLAFLNPEQGHYRTGAKYAMRPISPEGKVEWLEEDGEGGYEQTELGLEEAVRRIRSELE